MKSEKEPSIEQETVMDCPILFRMIGRPPTESIISFGFECGEGWHRIISDTSRELEMLNMQYYPKYRVRIQADQIKEKFSGLRFYYSIVQDPCAFVTWLAQMFGRIERYLSNYKKFDYKITRITDVEPFDYDDTREITKERYEEVTDVNYKGCKCSNVDYVEKDGKYFEICHLRNYGKTHIEPTRLKLLWNIKEFSRHLYHRLMYSATKDNSGIRNCKSYLDTKASEIIRKAEEKCDNTCEQCGHQIGTEWSPTCTTTGWITNLCEDCAKKQNSNYTMNGKVYNKGIEVKKSENIQKTK